MQTLLLQLVALEQNKITMAHTHRTWLLMSLMLGLSGVVTPLNKFKYGKVTIATSAWAPNLSMSSGG